MIGLAASSCSRLTSSAISAPVGERLPALSWPPGYSGHIALGQALAIAIFARYYFSRIAPGMPITKPKVQSAPSEATLLTKAALRAAEQLGMANKSLAAVIGVSEATVSRMRSGAYTLQRGQKSFELATLFVRFYRSLDAIVGGDQEVARAWLRNPNTALASAPLTLIQTVPGLMNAIHYLDARRAIV